MQDKKKYTTCNIIEVYILIIISSYFWLTLVLDMSFHITPRMHYLCNCGSITVSYTRLCSVNSHWICLVNQISNWWFIVSLAISSFQNETQMYSWTRQTLMSNLQTKIEPTKKYKKMCNRSVDLLVQHLYQIDNPTFIPREVVKAS